MITSNKVVGSKKKALNSEDYIKICIFIKQYHGLYIDCELEMQRKHFSNVDRLALKSILQTELSNRLRSQYWRFESQGKKYLQIFEQQSNRNDPTLLVKVANMDNVNPAMLCRVILQEKYKFENKSQLTRFMKFPHLINNSKLAANVVQCLSSDSLDGPLIDMRRRVLGEEYEFKLKKKALEVGMYFNEENELRRLGYDKTPDLKMIVPFLYKGEVVNWIESKATFGDVKTHKYYIQQQLYSYSNRFGTGIVIYWFGYHEETRQLRENHIGVIVLDDFPDVQHLTFLDLRAVGDDRTTSVHISN